jgi:hypothetical protein
MYIYVYIYIYIYIYTHGWAHTVVQCDELREDSESLVVMVALQHLRLVIANWRRAGYAKDLRAKIESVQEDLAREDAEMQEQHDKAAGQGPPDTLDIAKTMIRSISLEREQRERVGGTPRRKAQVCLSVCLWSVHLRMVQLRSERSACVACMLHS